MIERDSNHRLTWDSKAATAIRALPPAELTNQLWAMEKLYQDWAGREVSDEGIVLATRWWFRWRRAIAWAAAVPLRIFRAEIELMAGYCQEAMIGERARTAQTQFYQAYLTMVEQERLTRSLLREHFERHLLVAEDRNQPLPELVRQLLLELKGAAR